ncbi:hypothetical protein Salat_1087600 [Sesamum alatum]|uniref:Uncharacterized protein n=1 Tax=Sesamum alatum TaxID=300844 RepID=A0AAE1YNZ7_9LAMI|nr:hypothetical protein Salat_1087600 [Sesamum alatum]
MESLDELVGSHEKLTDSDNEIGYDHEVEMEKVGWVVIGVSVALIILTLVALIYHSKKARNTSDEESEPVPKPHKFAAKEETTQVPPSMHKKIEFFARHTTSQAIKEAPAVLNSHHICVPTVELIREIALGQAESNATFFPKHGSLSQPTAAPTPPSALDSPPPSTKEKYVYPFIMVENDCPDRRPSLVVVQRREGIMIVFFCKTLRSFCCGFEEA